MDFDVFLEQDEDGWFIAHVPLLPGCQTQGRTREEALTRVEEAIQAHLEVNGAPAGVASGSARMSVGA